jgi:hypothetical protein
VEVLIEVPAAIAVTVDHPFVGAVYTGRNVIVVGAPQRDRGSVRDVGIAYLFQSNADGTSWHWIATLDPNDDTSSNRKFGFSVSVSTNSTLQRTRVLIGATGAGAINGQVYVPSTGAAYMYIVNTTTLSVQLEVSPGQPSS